MAGGFGAGKGGGGQDKKCNSCKKKVNPRTNTNYTTISSICDEKLKNSRELQHVRAHEINETFPIIGCSCRWSGKHTVNSIILHL